MNQTVPSSHSAEVDIWLDCGPHGLLELSRVTPNSVIAKSFREIPPGFAELIVTVDGISKSIRLKLVNGFTKGRCAARAIVADDLIPF
jgi:hypothetical protein